MVDTQRANLLVKMRQILDRDDTIIFVGAGLSRWAGLPSWRVVIEELAHYLEVEGLNPQPVRKALEANDILLAASYGVGQLTDTQFGRFLRATCRVGDASPHEVHQKVAQLGPSCFITTNYDHLIEESLRRWRPDHYFKIVLNTNLVETGDIIQARAKEFVFKPHGDVDDSGNVILTHEQYRALYGDKKRVLDALKNLLVSRPVFYIGYSLRDPDFLYVKDLLSVLYGTGSIEHYAIMPNVSEEEGTFWRKYFGIHILSYPTIVGEGAPSFGHSAFLSVLDELLALDTDRTSETHPPKSNDYIGNISAELVLALARYATRVIALHTENEENLLPLTVSYDESQSEHDERWLWSRFDGSPVERFLGEFPSKVILIGNPGAGKTYAIKCACARTAEHMRDSCIEYESLPEDAEVPLYLDMKLYSGDIWKMAEDSLPLELRLDELVTAHRVRFFLDAVNEVRREYSVDGRFETDLAGFLERTAECAVIITSRSHDELLRFPLPQFRLDELSYNYVAAHLHQKDVLHDKPLAPDVVEILRKPLFFRFFGRDHRDIDMNARPHELLHSFFLHLDEDFLRRFGISLSTEQILSPIAFSALDDGVETIHTTYLRTSVRSTLSNQTHTPIAATEVVNWLISREVLVPVGQGQVAFFHQMITEYLAARSLAELYQVMPTVLPERLQYTRWDQAIFLTAAFLEHADAQRFIRDVINIDLLLAMRAVRFMETESEAVVEEILDHIAIMLSNTDRYFAMERELNVAFALMHLPISEHHLAHIEKILALGETIGGAAGKVLAQIKGHGVVDSFLNLIITAPSASNYNRNVALGAAIAPFVEAGDFAAALERITHYEMPDDDNEVVGLLSGLENAFRDLDIREVISQFSSLQQPSSIQYELFATILGNVTHDSNDWASANLGDQEIGVNLESARQALRVLIDLARTGINSAVVPLYFLIAYNNDWVEWDLFDEHLMRELRRKIQVHPRGEWAFSVLVIICRHRSDLSVWLDSEATAATGVEEIALIYARHGDSRELWDAWRRFAHVTVLDLDNQPLSLISHMSDASWKGNESLLLALLHFRNADLATGILETFYRQDYPLRISVEPIEWYLTWLKEVDADKSGQGYLFCSRLGMFLATQTVAETRTQLVEEFNKSESRYKEVLASYVLSHLKGVTTDSLNDVAQQYLVALLSNRLDPEVVGSLASETFVERHLLPLLATAEDPFRSLLIAVLRLAGSRHRRRYITEIDAGMAVNGT